MVIVNQPVLSQVLEIFLEGTAVKSASWKNNHYTHSILNLFWNKPDYKHTHSLSPFGKLSLSLSLSAQAGTLADRNLLLIPPYSMII